MIVLRSANYLTEVTGQMLNYVLINSAQMNLFSILLGSGLRHKRIVQSTHGICAVSKKARRTTSLMTYALVVVSEPRHTSLTELTNCAIDYLIHNM